ncbi:MAG: hypothetical protein LBB77_09590 [Treponema sp.]|nr:hypothetical protein [Treponema sp.]
MSRGEREPKVRRGIKPDSRINIDDKIALIALIEGALLDMETIDPTTLAITDPRTMEFILTSGNTYSFTKFSVTLGL